MLRSIFLAGAGAAALALAGGAQADGPGAGLSMGWDGVPAANGARYVTLPSQNGTVVAKIQRRGGRVVRYRQLRGSWALPTVVYGRAEGLSRDGRTLVLADAQMVFGGAQQAHTRFAIVDARTLELRRTITLPGQFSYDALSPGARTLYLTQYLSLQDLSRYVVRAYDLRTNRLLKRAIADRRAWGVTMQGFAMQRATTRGGRWVYTLYNKSPRPFVHMLDTQGRRAFCVNLPWRPTAQGIGRLRLRLERHGAKLAVWTLWGKRTLAEIDTATFRVERT